MSSHTAPTQPRAARAQEKRGRILAAAARVFIRDGFVGASVDRIASEAGVSKPTVYRYFDTKEQLFDEILRGVADQMLVRPRPAGRAGTGLAAELRAVARHAASVVLAEDTIALQRLATAESARFPTFARAFYQNGPRRAIAGFREMLRGYCESGQLAIQDLEMGASHFWSLTMGMPHRTKLIDPEWHMSDADVDRWIHGGVDAFLKLYATASAPAGAARAKSRTNQPNKRRLP